MVSRGSVAAIKSAPVAATGDTAVRGIGDLAARFLYLLPALVLALVCLRVAELAAVPGQGAARIIAPALLGDLIALLRYLPWLFLLSLPALLVRAERPARLLIGATWSLPVLVQAALIQYFLVARVPLGADLFAYSWREIDQTVAGGFRLDAAVVIGTVLALACLWSLLALLERRRYYRPSGRLAAIVFAVALIMLLFGPKQLAQSRSGSQDDFNLGVNKLAFFLDSSFGYLTRAPDAAASAADAADAAGGSALAQVNAGFKYLDPAHPFLHAEQTPDTLGPHFLVQRDSPPNLVFIIVEGLGRAFSGPDARLGSFTPFLDELGEQSLYWENFLATQGRTFAVLPSIFGSLPFGDKGFNELGERMPEHASLFSVLKPQGYRLKFFTGTDLDFDEQRAFLQRQGIDVLIGRQEFGPGYATANDWGYADGELFSRALAEQAGDGQQPFLSVLQTVSTHTPYTFPGQARYRQRFEERLRQLRIGDTERKDYRAYRDMYASILYVDDGLRRYFDEVKKLPGYANSIFIITGDHRLPEIPMATWIDRYHVPLIIYSPLLKSPQRIKSVSSDFDITPSLLAFLSKNYGLETPEQVTWLGSGLDLEPGFRNVHAFPLKQTKTDLVDFVSGTWFLSRDALYTLSDGMDMEPADNPAEQARVMEQFAAFRAANSRFAQTLALMPAGTATRLAAGDSLERKSLADRQQAASTAAPNAGLSVHEVRSPGHARAGNLNIEVVFANSPSAPPGAFVPLVVMLTANGREVSETYGPATTLEAGQTATLQLPVKTDGVAPGRYFLAVIPSDPQTGKARGAGRYHIPVVIDG